MVDFDRLTDSQKRAALAHDRNYALTAGAGSGKTTTFAARYVRLLDESGVSPKRIAAITFTESGAAELGERVRESVEERLETDDTDEYERWRDQFDELEAAYIHTIHGFCSRLLREHALYADVPVGFDVIRETGAKARQRRVVSEFVDDHLDDPRVELLTRLYYRDRFEEILGDLLAEHHRARAWADEWADADPEEYVETVRERFHAVDDEAARTHLRDRTVRDAISDVVTVASEESAGRNRIGIARNVRDAAERYGLSDGGVEAEDVEWCDAAAELCEALTTDGRLYKADWNYGGHDDWADENASRYDEATTTLLETLPVEEWATPDRIGVERSAGRYYVALASLYVDLHERYRADKRRDSVLDFADLIDEAVRLLRDEEGIRSRLAEQFEYVMLDEVQDTDPRQWELVELLTSADGAYDGRNVFVVGDEKQSIFRFRGADVAQFANERGRLGDANAAASLRPVEDIWPVDGDDDLGTNFRTLPSVLEPVNDLFADLFGTVPETHLDAPPGIDGDDTRFEPDPQRLDPAREDGDGIGRGATFVVVPEEREVREAALPPEHPLTDRPDDENDLDARALAAEVSALLDGETDRYETVETADGSSDERPTELKPEDVAVLLRKRTHLRAYERALAEQGVPYTVASGIGFYGAPEVVTLRNLFRVLANPADDRSLYAVLRSPLFGFDDDTVVRLWADIELADGERMGRNSGKLWPRLADADDEALVAASERLRRWRRIAGSGDESVAAPSWDAFLDRIVEDTAYLASLALDSRGKQAVANVDKLRERMRAWSEEGIRTLPAVVDRLERETDLASREGDAEVADDAEGVRIMTVHDAKGREFPAVFVPGLGNAFTQRLRTGDGVVEFERIGADREPWVGIKAPDPADVFEQRDTILKRRLRFVRKREAVAEEKRILYVAATRARDHLVLVGTAGTDGDAEIENVDRGDEDDPSSWYDFVAPYLVTDDAAEGLASDGNTAVSDAADRPFAVRLPRAGTVYEDDAERTPPELEPDVEPPTPRRTYSVAVSYLGSLVHRGAPGDAVCDHTGQYVSYYPPDRLPSEVGDELAEDGGRNPSARSEESFSATVFGDTVHKACELGVAADDRTTLRRLAEQFAAADGDCDPATVTESVVSELRAHVENAAAARDESVERSGHVRRECTVRADLPGGEVHGDIDRLVVTDDAYHVTDYKTNDVAGDEEIDRKAAFYEWQMKGYAAALHESDARRRVEATLLFTETGATRTFVWEASELAAIRTELDEEITRLLRSELAPGRERAN